MTLPRDLTLELMLAVEDDPAISEFVCRETRISLWSQVRIVFLEEMMSDRLYGKPISGGTGLSDQPGLAAITLARSIAHNRKMILSNQCRAQVCIMGGGIADEWQGSDWFNRLTDHFAQTNPPESVVFAEHFGWRWAFPRRHTRTMLQAPQQVLSNIAGKMLVRDHHRRQAAQLIDIVVRRAHRVLGWALGDQRQQALISRLAEKSASLGFKVHSYDAMLSRIQPKVILIDGACYGPSASLVVAARRRGIVTAEYQHGSISGGHVAYNFAPTLLADPAFKASLPEYFLSYGSWWSAQINAPVKHWIIGNPHRTEKLMREVCEPLAKNGLLILSDGIDFQRYLEMAQALEPSASKLGLVVQLRPHPRERTLVEAQYGGSVGKVRIDQTRDLYVSLRQAHVVVSEVSTGLFEAIGIADKIFLWDTPKARFGFPHHPFESFATVADLVDMLNCSSSGKLSADASDALWAPDWKRRYAEFLTTFHCAPAKS